MRRNGWRESGRVPGHAASALMPAVIITRPPEEFAAEPMPSIPLPFVISLMLGLILLRMIRDGTRGLFPLLVAVFTVQAALAGLNWGLGWGPARLVQPVLAATLPALSFAAFSELRHGGGMGISRLWPHLLPAAGVALLVAVWPLPIDLVLFATYLGYGIALLRLAAGGAGTLAATRFGDERAAHRALVLSGLFIILNGIVDAVISVEIMTGNGPRAETILAGASLLSLAVAAYAVTVAGASRPADETERADPTPPFPTPPLPPADAPPGPADVPSPVLTMAPSPEDAAIVGRIDAVMRGQHLYRDPDLTLERLARRTGIPARQISAALNRVHGRNVSQLVNEYRVEEARRRLVATRDPVTVVMLESGFGTKSNFNREFLRVTGMTPSAYRRTAGGAGPNGKADSDAEGVPAKP